MLTLSQRLILTAILTALVGLPSLLLWSALSAHGHRPAAPPPPATVRPVLVVHA
jgi:hypothetical protein